MRVVVRQGFYCTIVDGDMDQFSLYVCRRERHWFVHVRALPTGILCRRHGPIFTFRSLQTNTIPAILGRYPLLGFFCRLKIVPLGRDNGTSNSSNTGIVERVHFLVAASQHGGRPTSVAEGSYSTWTEIAFFGHFSRGDPSLWIFSKTKL